MKSILRSAALLPLLLALGLPATPAHAGDDMTGSEASMLVASASAMMIVSGPLYLSASSVNKVVEGSSKAFHGKDGKPRRISAGPLPDMKVKSIDTTEEGGRRVALEDPSNPENTATLQWPQREDNPAANFVVGGTVAFTPSPKGAGWMLRAEDGAVLSFVPTAEAAGDSHSATL